jgi:serine/threonine-protein kinase
MTSAPPAPPAPTDRLAFLEAACAAGLLTPAQRVRAAALPAGDGSAAAAAAALVEAGLLTRFQAGRLLAGRTDGFFLGPYAVLEQVGRGALSRVYKARHRTMNRPVAIKVMAPELTRTPAEREALDDEVRTAGRLAHPNIVTAYDANEYNDRFYLVLEFVDGADLGALVRQHGPLPLAEACEFVRQTAAGLRHAHEKGVVHRDIKPSNLLVGCPTPGAPPAVKIADFGIPKARVRIGPNPYAAPEAAGTGGADVRADLYSLGAVFHFMLTGREPGAVPLAQARPDVPAEVAAVVSRLLARDPAARFASAADVLSALQACVPVAVAVALETVNFDLPAYPPYRGRDSGYLTGRDAHQLSGFDPSQHSGRHEQPPEETPAEPSPWTQLDGDASDDTRPLERDETPAPVPVRVKPPGKGEPVPIWMTLALLVCVVLSCLMGIGVVGRLLCRPGRGDRC